jgi:hypothetical protein
MLMKRTLGKIILFLVLVLLLFQNVSAGKYGIEVSSVYLNGYSVKENEYLTFLINQKVEMSYRSEDYSFSGGQREGEYCVFLINRKIEINHSVGKDGENNFDDVLEIQKCLQRLNFYKGELNGKCNQQMIASIIKFQENNGLSPDGLISPSGVTLKTIKKAEKPKIFIQLIRNYSSNYNNIPLVSTLEFNTPDTVGTYIIQFCTIPFFTNFLLGNLVRDQEKTDNIKRIELNEDEEDYIRRDFVYSYLDFFTTLCTFKTVANNAEIKPRLAVFLKVNDEIPSMENTELINSGVSEQPIKFSWYTSQTDSLKNLVYSYRLYPDSYEWSNWQDNTETYYSFINTGRHEFEIKAKCIDKNGREFIIQMCYYAFTLTSPFISKPDPKQIIKASSQRTSQSEVTLPSKLYEKSKALLIGVTEFNDKRCNKLPPDYIKNDLDNLSSALKLNGFEIKRMEGNLTRTQIMNAIEDCFFDVGENDRVIIYFSSHGFRDPLNRWEGYITCSDTDLDKPTVNGISLSYIDTLIKREINKPTKHILVIADSCFAGLGIITKNTNYPDICRIALRSGAQMMTAGMSDQVVGMDNSLKMSTFTYYLCKGLTGEADYTKDKIITLTELLQYVQYEVACATHASQIPMLGKIIGEGEMIFDRR